MSAQINNGKVLVIGGKNLVLMYKMIGCEGIEERNPDNIAQIIETYAKRQDISVILVEKELGELISSDIENIRKKTGKIIFYLPSPSSAMEPTDIRKMVMRALGL
ncbi:MULTISPECIES: V-type ATP synthase subunit F [Fervidicoccus]|jgi:vacuolar-type H+-ATPase subunit F/Vma7|nr:V-type ATP synthase subunit F [Fervidicoccus fontis]PMB77151.1 MAG: V-type ATP synthase subunit F [Fervidicoccus fontis]HEW63637.1 V-type ATP synthase subunit F [Fervidicoccus fontis]